VAQHILRLGNNSFLSRDCFAAEIGVPWRRRPLQFSSALQPFATSPSAFKFFFIKTPRFSLFLRDPLGYVSYPLKFQQPLYVQGIVSLSFCACPVSIFLFGSRLVVGIFYWLLSLFNNSVLLHPYFKLRPESLSSVAHPFCPPLSAILTIAPFFSLEYHFCLFENPPPLRFFVCSLPVEFASPPTSSAPFPFVLFPFTKFCPASGSFFFFLVTRNVNGWAFF